MCHKLLTFIFCFFSFFSYSQSFEQIQQKYTEGLTAYQSGDIQRASQILKSAVAMAQQSFGAQSLEAVSPMMALGVVYMEMANYDQAEPMLTSSLAIVARAYGQKNETYAAICNNLSNLYVQQGLYDKAESKALEANAIITSITNRSNPEFGKTYYNLASIYTLKEEYAKADTYFDQAATAWRGVIDENNPLQAALYDGKAHAATKQGKYDKAKTYYEKALAIKANTIGENHIDYAKTCNNYSVLLYQFDDANLAIEYAEKAVSIYKAQLGENHPSIAIMLRTLSIAYVDNNELDKALQKAKDSKIIAEQWGHQTIEYALSCMHLGMVHSFMGTYDLSEGLLKEAREILEGMGKVNGTEYIKLMNASALLYENMGRIDESGTFHQRANELTLQTIDRQFGVLSEEEKRLYFKTFDFHLGTFYSFVTKRYTTHPEIAIQAYNMMLSTKGLLFESSRKIRRRIKQSKDASLKRLFADWQDQRKQIATAQTMTANERSANGYNLSAMEDNANRLEKALATKSALFSKLQNRNQPTWEDIRDRLKPYEAAVELVRVSYWAKEWQDSTIYVALIVRPETVGHPEIEIIEDGDYLETKGLSKYQKSIQFKVKDATSYGTFWQAIASRLDGIQKVYLAPDGVYHAISLNGLLNPKTNTYLGNELDISVVKSTRDLLAPTQKQERAGRKAKLLGYPNYNAERQNGTEETDSFEVRALSRGAATDQSTRFFDGSNIPLLPGTRQEIENLTSILESSGIPSDEYLNNSASESAVKSWRSPYIAHIATHGYFLKDQNLTSNKDKIGGISSEALIENPLLRSGLLFAGAREAIAEGGEGVLTAFEAMNLDLDDTELVVLSACETGLGEIRNGEGVYGLQRAFQAAGAKTIIMSLWTVNDDATQKLMTTFYKNWLSEGLSKRQAFKNAQVSLAKEYPHPYYWAAFVMIGEE